MKPTLLELLSPPLRAEFRGAYRQLRTGLNHVRRWSEWWIHAPSPSKPPRWLNPVGAGDFATVGNNFRRHLIELAGLEPHHQILDVGCGIGRMALPLTNYLNPSGGYEGLDIVPAGIAWCVEHITARYPHFRFRSANLYNRAYRPRGRARASEFTFPYANATFDCVLLASVFTHMMPAELERYLGEIARVLKPNGRCLVTYFLLNQESCRLMEQPGSLYHFAHKLPGCFTTDRNLPESAIAYDEAVIRQLYAENGLSIAEPIHFGNWCGRRPFRDGQDIVVATKNQA
jgi:ubiquinone/menaquinone biosynthesis C-methylase UbiE